MSLMKVHTRTTTEMLEVVVAPAEASTRGEVLRSYRVLRNVTVDQLARSLNVSTAYLYLIENGSRNPRDIDFWTNVANVLRIPWQLLHRHNGGDEPPGHHDGLSAADEEDILSACWTLFYRSGVLQAAPLVQSAMKRLTRRNDRDPSAHWQALLSRFHQLAGVLARDQGDLPTALRHGQIGLEFARQSGHADVLATALFRLGRTYAAQQLFNQAVTLSREATLLAPKCAAGLRGYLSQNLADMLAREGREPRYLIELRLNQATEMLALPDHQHADGSFTTLSATGIAHDWAMALLRLGAPRAECMDRLHQARQTLPADAVRWRTALDCTLVYAYATWGDVDAALTLAHALAPTVQSSRSHRKRLHASYTTLHRQFPHNPDIAAFGAHLGAQR